MDRIPFLLLGDGPAEPTGLGRIARDLAGLLTSSDLPIDLVQVGGVTPPVWTPWRHVGLDRSDDWGARNVEAIYRSIWQGQPGILFAVWDPSRLLPYLSIDLPVQRWAYCAIDGANIHEAIGGPAQAVLQQVDRVLAYNRYGAEVIKKTISKPVAFIPHGISLESTEPATPRETAWAAEQLGAHALNRTVLGCVMANQPRKDFGLLFHAIARLLDDGVNAYLWLHTDELVKAWSIPQLVTDFGLAKRVTVTGIDMARPYTDRELAVLYQSCAVTLLPSLGEGFGYPIVESLANGTPCVHSDWAGGAIYVPRTEWRVPVRDVRIESVYNIVRPVFHAEDWRNATRRALDWVKAEGQTGREYCRGAVAHLSWTSVRGRWQTWFKQGLQV